MTECRFENAAAEAARTGAWSDALRDHVRDCAACRETAGVVAAVQAMSQQTIDSAPPAPSYRPIWLRAEFARRRREESRRRRRQALIPAAMTIAVAAALVWWKGAWLRDDAPRELVAFVTGTSGALGEGVPLAAALGLVMFALVLFEELLGAET